MRTTIVIVGASVAGIRTAQGLRQRGYDDTLVLLEAESGLPYDKPPQSKDILAGASAVEHAGVVAENVLRKRDPWHARRFRLGGPINMGCGSSTSATRRPPATRSRSCWTVAGRSLSGRSQRRSGTSSRLGSRLAYRRGSVPRTLADSRSLFR